jgi:serine/threonine protein phosphatase PrpC
MENHAPYWQTFLEHAELSDVGLRRANNQDSMADMLAGNEVDFFRRGHLFVVADGMGRHAAGELASKISVDTIPLEYFKQPTAAPPVALKMAMEEANRRIHARGGQNPDFKGMGTTTCALALLPVGAIVAHVGDSRVYRLRGGTLEQLTFDHSVFWEMRAHAKANGTEVPANIPKNYITRSLGHDATVNVDLEGPFPLAQGDTFLLCSDGLTGPVDDEELAVLLSCLRPQEAVRVLVDLANLRGGPDNITVIVARVNDLSTVGTATPPKATSESPVPIAVWGALGAAALSAGILFGLGQTIAGAVASGVTLLLGLYTGALLTSGGRVSSAWQKYRLGQGPHTSQSYAATEPFVAKLAALTHQLRESAAQQNWKVNWPQFEKLVRDATMARNAENYPEAVRQYCYAFSYLMTEIRRQRDATKAAVLEDVE